MASFVRAPRQFPSPKGFVAKGFEDIWKAFTNNYTKGVDKGSSFAAFYKGNPVVHVWGGYADEGAGRPWREDTMSFYFSTTKFASAVAIAHLVERGHVDYSQKISTFWPEFSQNGKEDITLEMLISNKAGLVALDDNFDLRWMRDDLHKLSYALAKQTPHWSPGESHGYHPLTFGLYLDQVVRRTDRKQRSLSQYFHDEIAKPMGIDLYVGLPKELHHRVTRLEPQEDHIQYLTNTMKTLTVDTKLFEKAFSQPGDWHQLNNLNDPEFAELPCGSSHGVGTSLGVFWPMVASMRTRSCCPPRPSVC